MPRFFALSYFFFSLLFCSVSFAADDVPKEQQKIKQAVISNNQNYLYQELIAIQKQFTVLEVKLAQQNDSEKVKELEADFKKLNEDLIKLQELVDSNDKLKISELSNVDSRISDLTISTDRWGYTFSFFSLVITVAAIAMGISVVNKTKVEARKAAKLASDEWFKENQPNLFKPIREEVSSVRDNFESYIEEYDVELKKLKYEHEQHISALQDKALKEALSEAEKQEINASRTPDSETEFSLQDHFSAGIKAYINDDFSTAIQHWKRVSLSTDFENEASVISKSMFNLGITYGQEKSPSEEIEIYKQLIEQFTGHDNEEIQLQVAKAMMNLGVIYGQEKSPSEEIDMYKQLIEQFTGHDNEEIQLQVAKAMMNLGITYGQEKSPSEAIETYQQLIEQFTGHNNEEIQLQVAKTMMNLGSTYGQEKSPSEAIETYQQLIEQFTGHNNEEIQLQVAKTMMNLGSTYGQEKSPSEEIDMYKQLIEQFTGHDNEEIQLRVAKAMMNLGVTYGQEKSPSEAIETYQQLIEQFTGHNNEEIQLQVAKTMMNLGITYGQEKLFGKVISIFDELVQNFEGHDSAEIQGQVKVALANSAELSILFDEPKDVISRIEKVDLSNPDEQTATVMKLMRFLLDNVAFKEIVNSVELLPSDIELTWTFNEIKGYINDHFTGLKRQQIDAVVRFFEEHKDKEKFLEEARELQE